MYRKRFQRGVSAIALATVLALAGAQPAAAADPGLVSRIAGLWSVITIEPIWETVASWLGVDVSEKTLPQELSPPPAPNAGWTTDPNGHD